MRSLLFLFALLIISSVTFAQSITDTTFVIENVTVTGKRQHENRIVGSKMSAIAPIVIKQNQTRNMAELLTDHSLVHIKSMGQGGLSTSSFRGTGANHTQVNWNGININSAMMGNFDFSQFPAFFTDQVSLSHGSSDSRSGSGALGGSINLNNRLSAADSAGITAFIEGASFNTWSAAASAIYGKDKARMRTRVFGQMSDNDFRYFNKVLKKDPFEERREGSEYQQAGIMQEYYRKNDNNSTLSSTLWLNYYSRGLPQPTMVNRTKTEDENMGNMRFYTGWRHERESHTLSIKGAWLTDYYFYSNKFTQYDMGNVISENWSNAAILNGGYERMLFDNINMDAIVNYRFDVVNAENYTSSHVSRHTVSAQAKVEWQASDFMRLRVQGMAEQNDDILMPTFSAGVDYQVVPSLLTMLANVARNYHYPTLNDLYWSKLGNPDLRPEKGMSYDATARLNIAGGIVSYRTEITGYLMNVTDWIIWLRNAGGGYSDWSPSNLNKVRSKGVEVMTETSLNTGKIRHRINANYGYSSAVNRTKLFEGDRSYNKQIPYVPLHKANIRYYIDYGRLGVSYGAAFTGLRYITTDHSYSTTQYTVHDIEARYKVNNYLLLRGRINNLFDTYYESTQYFPMPLRSFALSVEVKL